MDKVLLARWLEDSGLGTAHEDGSIILRGIAGGDMRPEVEKFVRLVEEAASQAMCDKFVVNMRSMRVGIGRAT